MKYKIILSPKARKDLISLKKSGDKSLMSKIKNLFEELETHPYFGTGKPKKLKHELQRLYSRRITHKHRLIYLVSEETITILVLSISGHYDDK